MFHHLILQGSVPIFGQAEILRRLDHVVYVAPFPAQHRCDPQMPEPLALTCDLTDAALAHRRHF
jgi:hypothetical protein